MFSSQANLFLFWETQCFLSYFNLSAWYLQMLAEASEGRLKVINGDILEYNMETMFPESVKKQWHEGNGHFVS